MKRKGQAGIEIMVMLGIVLVISAIVLFGLSERNLTIEKSRQLLAGQKEAERVADAINAAAIGGTGFQLNLTVSDRVAGVDADLFKVFGKGRKVEMRWQGPRNETLVVSTRLITSNVKTTDLKTALINVNNTGDNIEVKCWNAAETDLQQC